jgi:hypothetical protein
MAIAFGSSIYVDHDGYVRWDFVSHPAAEASGIPSVSRGGYVGGFRPDDGTPVDAADLLVALECLATVMLTASRTLTPTRPLFGDGIEHLAHGFDA